MRGSVVVCASAVVALLSSGCLFGRPNKQIDKVEYKEGNTGQLSFQYDDDGYLTEMERDYDDGTDPAVWELKWEDGQLVEIEVDSGGETATFELEHDDAGRPDTIDLQGPTYSSKMTFSYDDSGRLERYEVKTSNDNDEAISQNETEVEYGDGGEIAEFTSTSTFGANTSKSTTEYTFDGARVQTSKTEGGDAETETEYAYDDSNRIESFESTSTQDGERTGSSETELTFGDDGFLESWTQVLTNQAGDEYEYETELSYNDADARGIDMSPSFMSIFFDMKGGAYNTIVDPKTQVTRFLLSQW